MGENPQLLPSIFKCKIIVFKEEIMGENSIFFGLEINSMVIYI